MECIRYTNTSVQPYTDNVGYEFYDTPWQLLVKKMQTIISLMMSIGSRGIIYAIMIKRGISVIYTIDLKPKHYQKPAHI